MTYPPLAYGRHLIDDADVAAVVATLRGDWLTQGPAVPEFEGALCKAFHAGYAVAVNSGTAALHLGMLALGIGPGDLVLVPPITFVASANAAIYCGADVAFIDVEPDTALISADALEEYLTSYRGPVRPRAVVAVHYAGLPCDMIRLGAICAKHQIELIEDACHAPGATWTAENSVIHTVGDSVGSAFTAFSFHPVKHFTTGEGGAVMTRNAELAEQVRTLRTHGITRKPAQLTRNDGPWWYEQHELGFNYRIPDILAALGTSQLTKYPQWLERRREIAHRYSEAFADSSFIKTQATRPGREHAYHLFPILVERRDEVFAHLAAQAIRPQVHYIPVHLQPFYRKRYGVLSLPNAETWYHRELSIPMFPSMSDEDVERVCSALAASHV